MFSSYHISFHKSIGLNHKTRGFHLCICIVFTFSGESTIVSRIFSIPEEMIQSLIREMKKRLSTVDFSKLDHALL